MGWGGLVGVEWDGKLESVTWFYFCVFQESIDPLKKPLKLYYLLKFIGTSGQPVLRTECLGGTEISLFSTKCTANSEAINDQQSTVRGLMVNSETIDDQHCWLLILGGGAGSIVNSERINSQIWNALPHFKIFNLFYLHLPINTFDIHNNAKFGLKRCTLTCPLPFNTLIYTRFHTCFANLCTWTLLILDKALPMMHHDIPTMQLTVDPLCIDC